MVLSNPSPKIVSGKEFERDVAGRYVEMPGWQFDAGSRKWQLLLANDVSGTDGVGLEVGLVYLGTLMRSLRPTIDDEDLGAAGGLPSG